MAGIPIGGEEEIVFRARLPIVTIVLIVLNVAIYIVSSYSNAFMSISESWVRSGGFIPILVISDSSQLYRFLTSMFLHGNIIHIFFNMYFLYIFGRAVENALGSWRYLALYMLSGFGASVFHTVFSALQGVASIESLSIPAIGASGAISGVLGAYLILFPGTSLTACWWFFWFPICYTLRAALYLVFWFVLQIVYGYTTAFSANPGIAFFAHAGGFIAGIAFLPILISSSRLYALKMRVSFFNYMRYILVPYRVSGLGVFTKLILGIMIASLIAGSLYAASSVPQTNIPAYKVDMTIHYTPPYPPIILKTSKIENHFVPVITDNRPRSQYYSDINILFNRLYALGLIINSSLAGKALYNTEISKRVSIEGVWVPVILHIDKAMYSDSGWLEYMSGTMKTHAVKLLRGVAKLEAEIVRIYTFQLTLFTTNLELIKSLALISIVLAIMAVYTIHRKSSELVLIT